jgi:hypothetical protein
MSDRKYRQRGYQDSGDRQSPHRAPKAPPVPRDPRLPRDPKTPNLPGFRQVFRCGRCGQESVPDIAAAGPCRKCGVHLHACINCAYFDSGARFECTQTIPARVSPKDAMNLCAFFAPRVTVERETGSAPASGSSSARKAFDDLFKF